jgi:signal transduction histidine kinase
VPAITADRLAVEQVFSNLIENALKYPAPGRPGRIQVDGRREGQFARFEVRDNGRGVAERDRERIFELFRRAGVQDTAGEGIGLAHVRALLRRMGGSIDCESEAGVGSTFVVRLPKSMK